MIKIQNRIYLELEQYEKYGKNVYIEICSFANSPTCVLHIGEMNAALELTSSECFKLAEFFRDAGFQASSVEQKQKEGVDAVFGMRRQPPTEE